MLKIINFIFLLFLFFSTSNIFAQEILLDLNKPVQSKIKENEIKTFTVNAQKGDFVRLEVTQLNADVKIKAFAPNQENYFAQTDNSNSTEEIEKLSFIAETDGIYRYSIELNFRFLSNLDINDCEAKLVQMRPFNEKDKVQIKAETLYNDATDLAFGRKDAESKQKSLVLLKESADLFKEVNDLRGQAFAYFVIGQVNSLITNIEISNDNYLLAEKIFEQLSAKPQLAMAFKTHAANYFAQTDNSNSFSNKR